MLLRQVMQGRSSGGDDASGLLWEVPPLEEGGLLADLDHLVTTTLGLLPAVPPRPELLPLPGSARPWVERLEGIVAALARPGGGAGPGRQAGVLVLDGMDNLLGARKKLADELLEAWQRLRDRGVPVHLVASWQKAPPEAWREDGSLMAMDLHPYRAAAWAGFGVRWGEEHRVGEGSAGWPEPAMGGTSPGSEGPGTRGAQLFRRWTVFGQHPTTLPGAFGPPWSGPIRHGEPGDPRRGPAFEDEIVARILDPAGDLFDAPLRRLAAGVQVPRRYVEILQAMAAQGSASGWGPMAERVGSVEGNRLAPYLQRLEEDGWIEVQQPLDGRPGGRRRRYALADPFTAFWFRFVFPLRSLLHREDPRHLFRNRILPHLDAHGADWLPVLARRWLRSHASEVLPAPAREVGGLWAGDVDVPIAARLTNGQVCYGLALGLPADAAAAGPELLDRLRGNMSEVRWGMGREARAPLLFVAGPITPELRRRVAATPLARLLTLDDLMGIHPPGVPS